MPTPAHLRLTVSGIFGTLIAPYERWSFRVNFGVGEGPTALAALADAGVANLAPILEGTKTVCRITEVKAASILATGLYAADPEIRPVNLPGTGSGGAEIPQVAMVASLMTGRRGATGRGRIYLPMPAADAGAGGVFTQQFADTTALRVANFLNGVNSGLGFGNAVVASTKGYVTPIEAVRVGRVPDTMRSRRTSIPEGYGTPVAVVP